MACGALGAGLEATGPPPKSQTNLTYVIKMAK